MTKPIDWTRPLRLVGTHEQAQVVQIDPARDWPLLVTWQRAGCCETYRSLNRAGQALGDKGLTGPLVENVPAEPRIVERWVLTPPSTQFGTLSVLPCNSRDDAFFALERRPGWHIARMLIEEPGE